MERCVGIAMGKRKLPQARKGMNGYLQSVTREAEARRRGFDVGSQITADAAVLEIQEVFGAGPKRAGEFMESLNRWANEIGNATLECVEAGDKDLSYVQERLDGRLKEILGEQFVPWDRRYGNR